MSIGNAYIIGLIFAVLLVKKVLLYKMFSKIADKFMKTRKGKRKPDFSPASFFATGLVHPFLFYSRYLLRLPYLLLQEYRCIMYHPY